MGLALICGKSQVDTAQQCSAIYEILSQISRKILQSVEKSLRTNTEMFADIINIALILCI